MPRVLLRPWAEGGPGYDNGVKLALTDACTPSDDNKFTKVWQDTNHYGPNFNLRHVKSGKCVHPDGGNANSDGVKLLLWDTCNEDHAQLRVEKLTEGNRQTRVSYKHSQAGRCVHPVASMTKDAQLHFWSGCAGDNAYWKEECVADS